jgi:hypothetical protein
MTSKLGLACQRPTLSLSHVACGPKATDCALRCGTIRRLDADDTSPSLTLWRFLRSLFGSLAASVGNSSLAKAFLAPCRINPGAGATRVIHYCEAGAVAFRDRL